MQLFPPDTSIFSLWHPFLYVCLSLSLCACVCLCLFLSVCLYVFLYELLYLCVSLWVRRLCVPMWNLVYVFVWVYIFLSICLDISVYDSMCMNMPLCESVCLCMIYFCCYYHFPPLFTRERKLRARERYTEEFFWVNEETQLCESWKGNNRKIINICNIQST